MTFEDFSYLDEIVQHLWVLKRPTEECFELAHNSVLVHQVDRLFHILGKGSPQYPSSPFGDMRRCVVPKTAKHRHWLTYEENPNNSGIVLFKPTNGRLGVPCRLDSDIQREPRGGLENLAGFEQVELGFFQSRLDRRYKGGVS